jgi:hypothetical protein
MNPDDQKSVANVALRFPQGNHFPKKIAACSKIVTARTMTLHCRANMLSNP